MNALIENFHLLAAAPNGVAKLRELILSLAVRGKLVPQDSNDEPASELLKKIAAEKARLLKEGKIKKDMPLPSIESGEQSYALPQGWEWVRLGDAVEVLDSLRKPVTKQDRELGPYPYYGASGVVDYVSNFIFDEPLVLVGEDGAKWGRGERTAFVISGKTWVNNHAHVLRPFRTALSDQFLVCTLVEMDLQQYITGMTVPKLNQARLNAIVLPLPPLAEQHRIVAKVDELMRLCDQLEAQQTTQGEAHERLVAALLDSLTQSADAQAFADNWARLAEHFELLFDTPESIAKLKQTLLQLAVQGKLVPQDPNVEPASELLKKIAVEKARLIKEGKMKKDKLLPEIGDDEKPYDLPQGWEWVRLLNLMPEFQNGISSRGDKDGRLVTVLRLADIKNRQISFEDTREIPIDSKDIEKYQLLSGDILITRVNGSPAIVGSFTLNDSVCDAIYCDHFIRMRIASDWISPRYLCLLSESALVRKKIQGLFITTAGQKTVNQGHIGSLNIPLPPLAEQHRIVAKVNELMQVCDALAERLTRSRDLAARLMETMVARAA